jgi:tRNA-splicing ligase RtcB
MGIPAGPCAERAKQILQQAHSAKESVAGVLETLKQLGAAPAAFADDPRYGDLAGLVAGHVAAVRRFEPREHDAPYSAWGNDFEPSAIAQMRNACKLPVSVAGALMPDAHVGYGLPIGGVLATKDAVIPYAVGVDIACRMKLSVFDLPVRALEDEKERLTHVLERETRFGVGASYRSPQQHDVMDRDWTVTPVTSKMKDRAWGQLGTSGSGNHFVEFGELQVTDDRVGLGKGRYLALLSHSGSRGTGAQVATHYSRLAKSLHPELPQDLSHLAWLDLSTEAGQEYWAAMELMGHYAAANHAVIHALVRRALGVELMLDVENHHNFAWRERHVTPGGSVEEVIVHRMSRTKAKELFTWDVAQAFLRDRNVTLLSAGLDEVPMAYKDIHEVMSAQQDLVEPLARFDPRLVKMAPSGEPPED